MAHNQSCAEAKLPGCDCACGGARHGCQGAFRVAGESLDVVLTYMKEWDERSTKLPSDQAVIGCAQADVVYWLHRDRRLLKCTKEAQTLTFEDAPEAPTQGMVLRKVAKHIDSQRMDDFQAWARETHFWCELLAQMARALAEYENVRGRMFSMVEDALQERDEQALPDELRRAGAIGSAVHWTWRYLLASIVAASGAGSLAALLARGDLQQLLWPIRVIAVLMCPDASHHPAVREFCWEPIVDLASAEMRDAVRKRLTQIFAKDPWFAPSPT